MSQVRKELKLIFDIDSLTDKVVSNETIIGSFLTTLGSLPVTLFLLVLFFELG